MGYMRHHAIVVTSWNDEAIEAARARAIELGCCVTDIVRGVTNGYRSFLVAPDGSNEGWEESDRGDALRDRFVNWANARRDEDGGSILSWAEVQFGDGNGDDRLLRTDRRPE